MQAGDLLLVDAAGELSGLTGDITRTYPIERPLQRRRSATSTRSSCGAGRRHQGGETAARRSDIQTACDDVLRAGLVQLGLVTEPTGNQFKIWATHGVSHWIGMDVHDVGVAHTPLQPGMAFTIEPGIYIREAALDNLPKTPENAAFIEKVRAAVQKYKDIGVRIEDSFLADRHGRGEPLRGRAANARRRRTIPRRARHALIW